MKQINDNGNVVDFVITAIGDPETGLPLSSGGNPPPFDLKTANGKLAGTFFGDDITSTHRIATLAAKWSQGLPIANIETSLNGTGRWYIPDDPIAAGFTDGVSIVETGTDADGLAFFSTKQRNRYEPGHLSYFGYTVAFKGIDTANGDFVALIGAVGRGSVSSGNSDKIKEGLLWGYVRESGITKKVLRVYKNYEYVETELDTQNSIDWTKLQIIEQQVGYYGIHPSILYYLDAVNKTIKALDYTEFVSEYTSIADPNLSLGVYLENQGNTTNIQLFNGSIEFGNYTTKPFAGDASGRNIADFFKIASKAVTTAPLTSGNTVAAYRVTDSFNAVKEYNVGGTVLADFESAIENQLLQIEGGAVASSPANLSIYIIPAADITATFTSVAPSVSVLQRALSAAISAISFTNAKFLYSINIASGGSGPFVAGGSNTGILEQIKPKLRPGDVAVLTIDSSTSQTITNIRCDLNTIDLF